MLLFNSSASLALTKYASIGFAVLTSILQVAFFARYLGEANMAFVMFVFGMANFAVFFDIATKPAYGILREKFCSGKSWGGAMVSMVRFCSLQALIFGVMFGALLVTVGLIMEHTLSWGVLLLLTLSITFTVLFAGLRMIVAALDNYALGEYLEFFRRIFWLFAVIAVTLDPTLNLTAVLMLAAVLTVSAILLYKLARLSGQPLAGFMKWRFADFRDTVTLVGRPGLNSLLVVGSEAITYNVGYLLISISGSPILLIQFGIWQRLYLAGSMLSQVGADILVHRSTASYFQNDLRTPRIIFKKSLIFAFTTVMVFLVILFVLEDWIFNIWLHGRYKFSQLELLALASWLGSNVLQHVSGIFLTYTGKSFKEMRDISASVAIGVLLVAVPVFVVTENLAMFLLCGAAIYFAGACFYLAKAFRLLTSPTDLVSGV